MTNAPPITTTPDGTPVDQLAGGPGTSTIDPGDPAAPSYDLLAVVRTPLSLREIMIQPVRRGTSGETERSTPNCCRRPRANCIRR